jgi:hypothetical protein
MTTPMITGMAIIIIIITTMTIITAMAICISATGLPGLRWRGCLRRG